MNLYEKLEQLTRKRKFFLLLFLIPAIMPPLTARGLWYLLDVPDFAIYVSNALFNYKIVYAQWMPTLHAVILMMLLLLLIFRQRLGRFFSFMVALNFAFSAYTQATVITEKYGLVILTEIFIWYSIVIALWFWDGCIQKTDYSFREGNRPWWLIPLAIVSFWDPDQAWNLSLSFFINGFSPTAFCMLTPIYLTVLLFAFPFTNLPLLRIHSFIGLVVGFISLLISFVQTPSAGIYWVLLHAPLIVVSLVTFRKSINLRPERLPELAS